MEHKEQARAVFLRYAEQYDAGNPLIRLKIEHTLRVAALTERYAVAVGSDAGDAALAWFHGLLHDIGRFEQVRRFGTFVDSRSVDHAELSADILFREGLIDRFPTAGLPADWRQITEPVIRLHNKLALPEGLDARTRRFAELLRDADKTDIFRVIASVPYEDRLDSGRARSPDAEGAGGAVMDCVLSHRCVPRGIRRSRFEAQLSYGCLAFELVYPVSRQTVKDDGWLLALLAERDAGGAMLWSARQTEQLRILRREIEKAWGFPL